MVQSLLRFGERVHIIRLQKAGKNALDFYLSYYLGKITAIDPKAIIGILSKDGGYDILVEHILANQNAESIIRLDSVEKVRQEMICQKSIEIDFTASDTDIKNIEVKENHQSLAPYFQTTLIALRAPNAFHPSRLNNLQQNLRKYILKDLFSDKSEEEQDKIINLVINKLKAYNLIAISEQGYIKYHISNDDILLKIQRYILHIKPKSFIDFRAAVQNRASVFGLDTDIHSIQKFARHLREQNLIRQNKGKIEYPPFSEALPSPSVENSDYPDQSVWQKVVAALSVASNKRPNKLKSLQNTIKAHIKCSDQEVTKIVQYLADHHFIKLDNNKITYTNKLSANSKT
ncbi:PIN domain-containing protein [Suttonella ornithocola]|uniref:PIN domain-containing protein n=1 Tax=Suttonella ornithocola TaxID=279832 RepID=UPI001FE24F1A